MDVGKMAALCASLDKILASIQSRIPLSVATTDAIFDCAEAEVLFGCRKPTHEICRSVIKVADPEAYVNELRNALQVLSHVLCDPVDS